MAMLLEITRYITIFYLAMQRNSLEHQQQPGLLDCITLRFSPFVTVIQYVSALLACVGHRLILLFGRDHCDGMEDWCNRFKDRARKLSKGLKLISAMVRDRHRELFESDGEPWILAGLGDERLTDEEHKGIVARFSNV